MSVNYEEIVRGETLMRHGPGERHERICERLYASVSRSASRVTTTRVLPPRTVIELCPGTLLRPDLTLVTAATGKAWLIAEVVDTVDHHPDTVMKKAIYEDARLPRLWMVDPRYDNVEIYHGSPYGLALQRILANRDLLTEALLPELNLAMAELFAMG
jgi:Uma2 family endonuclease